MTDPTTVLFASITFVVFLVACIAFSIGYGMGHSAGQREDGATIARLNERIADLLEDDDADGEWDDLGAQAELDEMILAAQRSDQ